MTSTRETIYAASKASKAPKTQVPDGLSRSLGKILRPQAAYRWLLPQLAAITPQYVEMTLRGALAGNHVQAWELFDLMEDTWPRLSKNANQLKMEVEEEVKSWRARPFQEEDEPVSESAKERARRVNAALFGMRPRAADDENDFGGTVRDLMDAWLKGQVVLETDWELRSAGKLGQVIAPRATFWAHPTCVAWSMEGRLGLRLELLSRDGGAQGTARPTNAGPTLTPGVWQSTSSQPMPSSVADFPEDKFLIGIRKAKSGTALGGALLRPLAWWWCAANFSADWLLNLAQLWSLPFRWANYDPNAPQATIDAICAMLENMGSNAWAAFPSGTTMELEYPSGGAGGNGPADNVLDRADKNCDLLVLGQTLTSDVSANAGSRSQGEVHERVEDKIKRAACGYVATVLNTQLIPSILRLNYGDDADTEAPQFRAEDEEEGTLAFKRTLLGNWSQHATLSAVMANLTDLKQMVRDSGLPVNEEYEDPYVPVKDAQGNMITGELMTDGKDVIGAKTEAPAQTETLTSETLKAPGGGPGGGPGGLPPAPAGAGKGPGATDSLKGKDRKGTSGLVRSGSDLVVEAMLAEFGDLNARIEAAANVDDPALQKQRLAAVLADLESFKANLSHDPAIGNAIYKVLTAAFFNGATE